MTVQRPTEQVDPQDIPAVAAAILKLIENPGNHCKHKYAVDASGEDLNWPVKPESNEVYNQVCLASAFSLTTGVNVWQDKGCYVSKFSQAVFEETNICYANNDLTHDQIVKCLKAAAKISVPA